ncbi:hypothetical protein FY528_02390 [Hymenobacter lutimineralis]|uniref:DUF3887 domain-containing protein n=1 Tax=Hymenobacter lutimineralis TaxID=2606448 RepID=A0A5D6VDM3_9BACT|nr:hypothetical protein [Hymenobacter lutimineralis]TYZ13282.1 hypothetical protein FY528_02390 [Hymenobacter lutimineralis]
MRLPKLLLTTLGLLSGTLLQPDSRAEPKPLSQVQVARQFLLAVLRADYPTAYGFLEAGVAQRLTPVQFAAAMQPVYAQGQQFGPDFALYKLGLRLGEGNTIRPFCAFTFKSDTLAGAPHVQLDVSFRDSVATRILYFTPVPAAAHQPSLPLVP